ncbi:MAG: hypothetical protein SHS37scaffold537_47 [Phage 68_12]|nr:MAG: hypothetical protein SHS37scaffold537_47 [Phage 68_12]
MIRRFRARKAAQHRALAEQHNDTIETAVELYISLGDTPHEAWLRVDQLTSTDYHRARARLHTALADKWDPDA